MTTSRSVSRRATAALPLSLLLAWCALLPSPATRGAEGEQQDQPTVGKALKEGKLAVALRYRFENVSDDAPAVRDKDAHASTLRSTLAYRSDRFRGFSAFVEVEDVTDLGLDDQHDNAGAGALSNGVTDRPAIADPDLTEMNQAYLRYGGFAGTTITAGRQEFKLGDERFVGPVGWRQNHQSFDAVRLETKRVRRTTLNYVFLRNVNRPVGDNKPMASHLLDADVRLGARGRLAPYVYVLDYDDAADAGLSTSTYGIRYTDRRTWRGWALPFHVEVAQQRDAGDNPQRVDAGYFRVEIGGRRERLWLKLGYEVQEGSAADGRFTTPLATLHRYNGWADKFTLTPTNGLEDLYLAVGGNRGRLSGLLVVHDFGSDSLGLDYGSEVDARLRYDAPWEQAFVLDVALYDADTFAADTDKFMLWTTYSF